jgi:outer membrane receptor protein involved in Fe transport
VPRTTAFGAVQWRGPRGIEADAELQRQGRIFFDEANQTTEDGYALVNLRAGIRRGAWALHAYVRNAADARYVTLIAPGFFRVPGPPRRVGLTFSIER